MSLLDYEKRFSTLRVNSGGANKSPHKVAMLQAVIDLVESGEVTNNRFYFDDNLKSYFTQRFQELASSSDRNNPHLPYFHLRSEGFWHLKVRPGQHDSYEQLKTATSPGVINTHIDHAYLDDELFELLGNQIARELLRSALLTSLDEKSIRDLLQTERGGWDWLECEFLVNDYVTMLEKHLVGASYSKAAHRRALQPRLNNRSEGSIEYKHQNVSAVLLELELPYIPGYKPAFNYQQQLKQVVLSYLAGHQKIIDDVTVVADNVADEPEYYDLDWDSVFDPEPPECIPHVAEGRPSYLAKRIGFSERERRNRQLGERAEEFVLRMEKQRLTAQGRSDLAAEVEWSSKKHGDGLGFDIRSFDATGDQERFLEVKATNSGKYLPFFISENERAFSNDFSDAFRLYRVYEFTNSPRFFILPGAIEQHVHLLPQNYRARF
ncbi:hypothetical protein RE428_25340 [Marinobacter nanhaiticus D15-8W]|uniref:DUF3883 domain-containing protein n=1 Tax=Marinobacter nanhaiticus D15-8W TaxID=626887 RepID=N6WSY9_9GAMM|nr:DUF3883 domain-containing protein [Marinobacter nanhaiticus]ENO14132.2 DUF3883 domain-containing protein [Marinobacter nanhaiticus D15-8W]BES71516.1 hypothetical protein RE428_25340 [Marinobacter nanhaiticus D15-8W]